VVVCLEQGADLRMAQLMPLPPTVSCFTEIHIGFTFLVPAHLGSPGKRAIKRVCVAVAVAVAVCVFGCGCGCVCGCDLIFHQLFFTGRESVEMNNAGFYKPFLPS